MPGSFGEGVDDKKDDAIIDPLTTFEVALQRAFGRPADPRALYTDLNPFSIAAFSKVFQQSLADYTAPSTPDEKAEEVHENRSLMRTRSFNTEGYAELAFPDQIKDLFIALPSLIREHGYIQATAMFYDQLYAQAHAILRAAGAFAGGVPLEFQRGLVDQLIMLWGTTTLEFYLQKLLPERDRSNDYLMNFLRAFMTAANQFAITFTPELRDIFLHGSVIMEESSHRALLLNFLKTQYFVEGNSDLQQSSWVEKYCLQMSMFFEGPMYAAFVKASLGVSSSSGLDERVHVDNAIDAVRPLDLVMPQQPPQEKSAAIKPVMKVASKVVPRSAGASIARRALLGIGIGLAILAAVAVIAALVAVTHGGAVVPLLLGGAKVISSVLPFVPVAANLAGAAAVLSVTAVSVMAVFSVCISSVVEVVKRVSFTRHSKAPTAAPAAKPRDGIKLTAASHEDPFVDDHGNFGASLGSSNTSTHRRVAERLGFPRTDSAHEDPFVGDHGNFGASLGSSNTSTHRRVAERLGFPRTDSASSLSSVGSVRTVHSAGFLSFSAGFSTSPVSTPSARPRATVEGADAITPGSSPSSAP